MAEKASIGKYDIIYVRKNEQHKKWIQGFFHGLCVNENDIFPHAQFLELFRLVRFIGSQNHNFSPGNSSVSSISICS